MSIAPLSTTDWWGYDVALTATARNTSNAVVSPTPQLSWTSSSATVATVNSAGLVTLNRQGTATISAETATGVLGSATVIARGFADLGSSELDNQCVISNDRLQILCWGWSGVSSQPMIPNRRDLGNYAEPTPIRQGAIPVNARIKQVSVSTSHGCALTEAGQVFCWGDGLWGKLGSGNENDVTAPVAVVQGQIPAGVTLTSIGTAPHHTCATASDGRIYCWGDGARLPVTGLPLGNSAQVEPLLANLSQVATGVSMVAVLPGLNRGWALGDNGRAYVWTSDSRAMTLVEQGLVPVNVRLVQISADDQFACAVGDDGRAYCWGNGFGLRFGDGGDTFRGGLSAPTVVARGAVPAGVRLVSVTVGGISNASCALGGDGNIYCWGRGFEGSLGNGNLADNVALTPTRVLDGERPTGVMFTHAACGQYHCTALGDDGRAYTWGYNEGRALARPTTVRAVAQPTLVTRPNRD
ncbi:MAG: hypothetical protein MUF44_07475 [Hydrogenophaga sp.]|nr:hypothetical protein [Hydrogenophaga sp.]